MTDRTVDKQNKPWQFQKGAPSPNPTGRPKGTKNKLSEAFIEDLHSDWLEHGKSVLKATREQNPGQYMRVVASLLPKDVNLQVTAVDEMPDEHIDETLAAVRRLIEARKGTGTEAAEEGRKGKPH
jgi:hypothetical protein